MLKYHIQTIEVGSGGAASISFTSIPQTYTDLFVVLTGRSARVSPTTDDVVFQLNSDATNQSTRWLWGSGSGVVTATDTQPLIGEYPTSTYTANTFGSYQVYIPNYTSSNPKSFSAEGVGENNATAAYQVIAAGLYNSTDAITSILIKTGSGSSLVQYSSASLYGIKHGSSGEIEVAAGGVVTASGGYTIHTFGSSGTFVANRDLDVEYLVVAGGGGGGTLRGGGGGAGGYRSSVSGESSGGGNSAEARIRVSSGESYVVAVGGGGAGSASATLTGVSGSSSTFSTVTSIGGGGGDSNNVLLALSGGSGGGSVNTGTAGQGFAGQGFAGGVGSGGGSTQASGGGGGAGAAGANAVSGNGGAGGAGVTSSITGSAVARAGGGGGGAQDGTGGAGGSGVGGAGTDDATTAGAGTVNTGSGGGGGGWTGSSAGVGGAGGSGVVIIRYLTPA